MIPPDVASRLQVTADSALRPVAPTQELTDKLSGLIAGQKVMAEIQAMLPNGTYRAVINQRNITLALPFAAKSGDSLELLVTESDGKIALAVVSHRDGQGGGKEAVSTTLSRTAQFISQLFSRSEGSKEGGKALILNGNQPIAQTPPNSAQDILPLLKQAITQSGMFYESHQAEWVEGRFPKAALLHEPQGKLSSPATSTSTLPAQAPTLPGSPPTLENSAGMLQKTAGEAAPAQNAGQLVAPQTQPIVQQQLDALATQNFAWQGQVWPGQEMEWRIEEDGDNSGRDGSGVPEGWKTRLNLSLPVLGGVNALIHIQGDNIALSISVDNPQTRSLMQTESDGLRQQLIAAGLTATQIGISETPDGLANEEAEKQ